MKDITGLLYARPSFWEGFARIFDFGGALNEYNVSQSTAEADYLALKSDFIAIEEDFKNTVAQYERDHQEDLIKALEQHESEINGKELVCG